MKKMFFCCWRNSIRHGVNVYHMREEHCANERLFNLIELTTLSHFGREIFCYTWDGRFWFSRFPRNRLFFEEIQSRYWFNNISWWIPRTKNQCKTCLIFSINEMLVGWNVWEKCPNIWFKFGQWNLTCSETNEKRNMESIMICFIRFKVRISYWKYNNSTFLNIFLRNENQIYFFKCGIEL